MSGFLCWLFGHKNLDGDVIPDYCERCGVLFLEYEDDE